MQINPAIKLESEPGCNIIIVDFLRHGSTEYKENGYSEDEKENLGRNIPRDLTPKGEKEVREYANRLVEKIDPENEIVVFLSSPAWRAQGSEDIIREVLEKNGISIYKDSTIKSMRNFDQHDLSFMNDLWLELAPTNSSAELAYSRDPRFQEKNDKFETLSEVRIRAGRVFNQIRHLAKIANLRGKKLHMIGVTHFEFINPIMEDIFGPKIEDNKGVSKGEGLRITFNFQRDSGKMIISADFRNEHADNIVFDENKRRFLIEE